MNLDIRAVIKIYDEIDVHILNSTISPENATMPKESGFVKSSIIDNVFVSTIEGNMSIGRLINTMDDIIKTAILSKNIVDSSKKVTT
ncbi:MAG: hypothetical protein HeimC2_01550 [Candidatus Heimdallarchaeota archaeon LC_2]|nr:MAG: hypothetical protein HeimC2_01550 [Candidatus Heimdallarchaeota archaeon LC_2]